MKQPFKDPRFLVELSAIFRPRKGEITKNYEEEKSQTDYGEILKLKMLNGGRPFSFYRKLRLIERHFGLSSI